MTRQSDNLMPQRALISVSDKTGIVELAKALQTRDIEILSTGGTAEHLRQAGIAVIDVSDVTRFPEIMNGRVKTLHPAVFAGILGKRDEHAQQAHEHNIQWIDLVICNLYPFGEVIARPDTDFDQAIENIDIGGPSLLRAAAKNMAWTAVVVDSGDYADIIEVLTNGTGIGFDQRKRLATKAFAHTAAYDSRIQHYLTSEPLPQTLNLSYEKQATLRYGENPEQQAAAYRLPQPCDGVLAAKQHQGKPLSYNNILDADAARQCVTMFERPACVVVKHNNPCGVAVADKIDDAFARAWAADSLSAFGGIVALNRACTPEIARQLAEVFIEVLLAPDYDAQALDSLSRKKNLRILELPVNRRMLENMQLRSIEGGLLLQSEDNAPLAIDDCRCVTETAPDTRQKQDLLFAWNVVKQVKSNAILLADGETTLGIGAGQVSRIDAVDIALRKAGQYKRAVLASDAFFPFRDSIDRLAEHPINAIIQPGGSIRDEEVIAACNKRGIAMLFTGKRCFKH